MLYGNLLLTAQKSSGGSNTGAHALEKKRPLVINGEERSSAESQKDAGKKLVANRVKSSVSNIMSVLFEVQHQH